MADRSESGRRPRPTDADGCRDAWAASENLWQQTIEKASRLPTPLLHERVEDEWSFIETLRHLLFVSDAWVSQPCSASERRTTRSTCHPQG